MIEQLSHDGGGWARLSDDLTMRFRLGRKLSSAAANYPWPLIRDRATSLRIVTFVAVNPSTADAFKPDPTVTRCCEFARRWGADVLEVVNLFALRSTDPNGLDALPMRKRGDGVDNDDEIAAACAGAHRVIAAWGDNGWRGARDQEVRRMLGELGVELHHLGLTKSGRPKHPLARGKSFIPYDHELSAFAATGSK